MAKPTKFLSHFGNWSFQNLDRIRFLSQDQRSRESFAICNENIGEGLIKVKICFPKKVTEARILFGFKSTDARFFSAGIGGWERAYSIQEYVPQFGYRGVKLGGSIANIVVGTEYELEVKLSPGNVRLFADGIKVLEHYFESPLVGEQCGLFAVDGEEVEFSDFDISPSSGKAFVVMQFSEPYNSIYSDVIQPVLSDPEFHITPIRADDIFGPGAILNDILRELIESKIVIAEVSPNNPNVFYELGYAHALNKPTILLCEKNPLEPRKLPFDIQGLRVVFYENTIKGKKKIEEDLIKHLTAILGL